MMSDRGSTALDTSSLKRNRFAVNKTRIEEMRIDLVFDGRGVRHPVLFSDLSVARYDS